MSAAELEAAMDHDEPEPDLPVLATGTQGGRVAAGLGALSGAPVGSLSKLFAPLTKNPAPPFKEAMQAIADAKVIDGVMPLRIEAQRVEELRAALRLQRENDVPLIVLEHAYAAGEVADEIAEQGAVSRSYLDDCALLKVANAIQQVKRGPAVVFP